MIAQKMKPLVTGGSAIRAMFEEGRRMAAEVGPENVYDFSLGNPSVPAPAGVEAAIREVLDTEDPLLIHGYMPNAGFADVRRAVAENLNSRFGTGYTEQHILMTVGAASGLNVILRTLVDPGEEVVTFSPYFVEYGNYTDNVFARLVVVPADAATFQPDPAALEAAITEKTRAVIINTPHNPTGVIYGEETLRAIADVLRRAGERFGKPVYLLSDEPYRELAYDGAQVPYPANYYENTITCYSFSKSLSLPGERIGYLAVRPEADGAEEIIGAATIANRIWGSVNAPSLMQRVILRCLDLKTDVEAYDTNRRLLYDGMTALGFDCVRPAGAFYLWVRSPEADEKAFCAKAKAHHILMVPGSSFAWPGYVRLAYCVSADMIRRSMPAFAALAQEYGLKA